MVYLSVGLSVLSVHVWRAEQAQLTKELTLQMKDSHQIQAQVPSLNGDLNNFVRRSTQCSIDIVQFSRCLFRVAKLLRSQFRPQDHLVAIKA